MSLNVRHFGSKSGPVLLLLHGMPTTPDVLDAFGHAFADRALVVVPDLPGYGTSSAVRPYRFEQSHALVEAAVERLAPGRPVHVLGYSAGGYRGFDLAVRKRLQVRSVVALASVAGYPAPVLEAFANVASALRSGLDLTPIGTGMLSAAGRNDPALLEQTRRWMAACPLELLAEEFDACSTMPDLHDSVAKLGIDVLFRVGAQDANVVPDAVRASAERIPGSRIEIVPDHAHALPLEDRAGTLASLESFWGTKLEISGAAAP